MNQIYTITFLFIFGFTLPLCGQIGLQFNQLEENLPSVVFSNNIYSYPNDINNKLQLQDWQVKSKKENAGKAFLIWTTAGMATGFLTGYIIGIAQGDSHDNTKENYAMIYGTSMGMIGGGAGVIIGLGHALSISSRQPKEEPRFLY